MADREGPTLIQIYTCEGCEHWMPEVMDSGRCGKHPDMIGTLIMRMITPPWCPLMPKEKESNE